jgi:hypothetical protein
MKIKSAAFEPAISSIGVVGEVKCAKDVGDGGREFACSRRFVERACRAGEEVAD